MVIRKLTSVLYLDGRVTIYKKIIRKLHKKKEKD